MIESFAEVGKAYRQTTGKNVFDLILEYPKADKILAICVDTKNRQAYVSDEGATTREKIVKTLYTTPPSKGPGATPTAKLNMKEPEKTLRDKIISWFKKHEQKDIAEVISTSISAERIREHLGGAKSVILTVKIDGKWPIELPEIVEEFKKYGNKKMYMGTYGGKLVTSKSQGICAICGKKVEVMGFILSWAKMTFGTADKPGFFENLDVTNAWKMLPICKECAWNLRIGWNIVLDRERDFSVGGLHYLVLPSKGASEEEIEEFIESIKSPKSALAVFRELAKAEETIEDIKTNIDLIVYRREQAKMEVYLLEQNIPPGIFRKIRKRNRDVAKIIEWERDSSEIAIIRAYVDILNAAYSDEKSKNKKFKELAQIIHALIREQSWPGRKYAYFTRYIEKIAHNEQKGLDYAYRAPLFAYLYFAGGDPLFENVIENIVENIKSKTAEFAFWTGLLARHVVEMQRKAGFQPGTEPFRKRIKNVRMNVHQLQRLFTEAFEKAKAYSEILGEPWITRTNRILEACAEKATRVGASTPDEIGFFFAVGYGLYWKAVASKAEGGGEEHEG